MNEFKLSTKGLDDLFSTQAQRDEERLSKIREISIDLIDPFPQHPYHVEDNEDMQQLAASIKEHGVITPATVIAKPDGRYTLVAGHRRKHAAELAGLTTLRCEVVDLSEDEATVLMVDSNLHREKILPSEKAYAYKMRLEAMKRQGQRTDLTSSQVGTKLRSDAELAEKVGESRNQIQRYIRLTELIPELLKLTDEGKLKLLPAVELSYLNREAQELLADVIRELHKIPSLAQAKEIRSADSEDRLYYDELIELLNPKPKAMYRIDGEKLRQYIPASVPDEDAESYIIRALQFYGERKEATETLVY